MKVRDDVATGNVAWVVPIVDSPSQDTSYVNSISFDQGMILVTFRVYETTVFHSTDGAVMEVTSRGKADLGVSRYDTDGKLLAVQRMGGSDNEGGSLVAKNGMVYLGMYSWSTDGDVGASPPDATYPTAFPNDSGGLESYLIKLNSQAPIVMTMNPVTVAKDTVTTLTANAVAGDLITDLSSAIVWTDESGAPLGVGATVGVTLPLGTHRITASVTDPVTGLIGMAGTVVTVADLTPSIVVAPLSSNQVSEDGTSITFDVVLSTPPTDDVTIPIVSDDPTEGAVNVASLTFTPNNWNQSQMVTVTGVDDAEVDGSVAFHVRLEQAVSNDEAYAELDAADISITNLDNDSVQTDTVIYVEQIRFLSRVRGKNPIEYQVAVQVRQDSNHNGIRDQDDLPIEGVFVKVTFAGNTYTGVTDRYGYFVTNSVSGLAIGSYYANADLSLSDYVWARYLDVPDDSDDDLLGLPDTLLTI